MEATSSVPMTSWSDDVIVLAKKFVIVLVSVDKPYGYLKQRQQSTETRAITDFLACTMTSSDQDVISNDEVALIRRPTKILLR